MIVATNQPYFAPYPGFFLKAHLADCFVILDAVQFPRRTTWITRNRFKNDQGTLWVTIPVLKKGLGFQKIRDVRICYAENWPQRLQRTFEHAYARAPYLYDFVGVMETVLSARPVWLLDLNLEILQALLDYLAIDTRVVLMSELGSAGKGTALIIDICKALGADRFLVQSSARAYYDSSAFSAEGLELIYFSKPRYIYPQLWGDFIENLSVLDLLFNCGPKTREIILG
ncbi:MAG: hypothetical protein [Olavius algarvensis Delta 4 endosymbiont]|nr:MAG: hypothetical protein [Olavius algarvensis Delta 4 endosymbiont]